MSKLQPKSILIINYFDAETNKSCLDGLSDEEQKTFRSLVLKQFDNGIEIKVSYKTVSEEELLAKRKADTILLVKS